MQLKKNDKIELDIIDMTKEGLGLAKLDGQVFFVKDGLLGDRVEAIITKVTKNIIYAKVSTLIKESKYRVPSKCEVANACGGCQLLCLNSLEQLKLKINYVTQCLTNIGKFGEEYNDVVYHDGSSFCMDPVHFRNKMQVPFSKKNGRIIYGFYAGRTHHIVEFKKCIVGFLGAEIILEAIKNSLKRFNISIYDEESGDGVFREVMLRIGNVSKEVSITYIVNDKKYNNNLDKYKDFDRDVRESVENLIAQKKNSNNNVDDKNACDFKIVTSTLNINTSNNNVLFGNKNVVLYGLGFIEDSIGDVKYRISPESFYQVNMEMTKDIYDRVVKFAEFKGDENVLDLYSGIGTISLYIAKYVKKVVGLEIVEKAVENAIENAKLNGIENVEFICEDLSKIAIADIKNTLKSGKKSSKDIDKILMNKDETYDTIIVDPPRKGLDDRTIDFIKNINPNKIVYVSCDPATLARDLDILCHKMSLYKLEKIANVDMFPHTMHIETIAKLYRI